MQKSALLATNMHFFSLLVFILFATAAASRLEQLPIEALFPVLANMDAKSLDNTLTLNRNLNDKVRKFFSQAAIGKYFTEILARDYNTFLGALRLYKNRL